MATLLPGSNHCLRICALRIPQAAVQVHRKEPCLYRGFPL
jgi:hypothetical protein